MAGPSPSPLPVQIGLLENLEIHSKIPLDISPETLPEIYTGILSKIPPGMLSENPSR